MTEEWRTVIDDDGNEWTNYEVSNYGNVRSLNYKKTGETKILKQNVNKKGYFVVTLCEKKRRKQFRVHRLVAFVFVENDDVENKTQVNHIDENKENNHYTNLEWCTVKYNNTHGTRTKRSIQKISKRVKCVETGIIYNSANDAGRKTGLSQPNITRCCQKKKGFDTCGGYHWEYVD